MPSLRPVATPQWIGAPPDSPDNDPTDSSDGSSDASGASDVSDYTPLSQRNPETPRTKDTFERKQARRTAKDLVLAMGRDTREAPWRNDAYASDMLVSAGVNVIHSNPRKAVRLFDQAFVLTEDHMPVYWRAMAEGEMNEPQEAILDLDACILVAPKFADAWNLRGQMHRKLGHAAEAKADFERAVRLSPMTWEFRMNRGLCLFAEKKWRAAAEDLEAAKSWSFFEEEAWVALVKCHMRMGNEPRALQVVSHALCCESDSEALMALEKRLVARGVKLPPPRAPRQ